MARRTPAQKLKECMAKRRWPIPKICLMVARSIRMESCRFEGVNLSPIVGPNPR